MYALETKDGQYATVHNGKPYLTPNARLAYVWKTAQEAEFSIKSFSAILRVSFAVSEIA